MHDANSAQAHVLVARGFWKRGDLTSAVRELHAALECDPNCLEAHYGLGTVRAARNEFHAAVEALKRALALAPDNAAIHLALATALVSVGRHSDARAALRRVLSLDDAELALEAQDLLVRLPALGQPAGRVSRAPAAPRSKLPRKAAAASLCLMMMWVGAELRVQWDSGAIGARAALSQSGRMKPRESSPVRQLGLRSTTPVVRSAAADPAG